MPKKRTGAPSLAYMGVESSTPPQLTVVNRAPNANDYANYIIGHIWIHDTGVAGLEEVWILVDKRAHVSTWIQFNQGGGVPTFPCDVGQAVSVGGITNTLGAWNINTVGAGNTIDVYLDTSIHQPLTNAAGDEGVYYLGSAAGVGGNTFMHAMGTQNTFLGESSGNLALNVGNARRNVGIGYQTLVTNVDGENNVAVGESALATINTGDRNVAVGHGNSDQATDIDFNTSVGGDGLTQLLTGDYNSTLGYRSGFNYTGNESSNILIGNEGTLGDGNTIRIGEQGAGAGQQDTCFIAGVHGEAVGGVNEIVYIDNAGQVGSTRGANGQVLIGATGASPLWAPIVSGDGTVLITLGANSIDLRSAGGGAGGATTFNTDVAGPAVILGNVINVLGDGIIQTDGTVANTVTVQLPDGANGEVLIGGGGAAPVWGNITAGAGINVANGANTITISAPGAGGGSTNFNTDVGGPAIVAAGDIDILGGNNITTTGAGQVVTVDLDDSIALPDTNAAGTEGLYSLASGTTFMHNYGAAGTSYNTFLGQDAGNLTLTTAVDDTGIGFEALNSLTTGNYNTMCGSGAGKDETTGSNNSGLGMDVLFQINAASNNSCLGFESFNGIVTGSNNIGLGYQAGGNCTAADSSNILIGNPGAAGLNNTIKIGTDGAGVGQQDTTFIHGIYGVAPGGGGLQEVTIDANGQLGSRVGGVGTVTSVTAGNNIVMTGTAQDPIVNVTDNVTIPGTYRSTAGSVLLNAGSVYIEDGWVQLGTALDAYPLSGAIIAGNMNNILKANATGIWIGPTGTTRNNSVNIMGDNTGTNDNVSIGTGSAAGDFSVAIGALAGHIASPNNVAIGYRSQEGAGGGNASVGAYAGRGIAGGRDNAILGYLSGNALVGGSYNSILGSNSLTGNAGSNNIAIGYHSGDNYTGAESSNILIGSEGVLADGNTIRIGTQGAGAGQQDTAFIAGVYNTPLPGAAQTVYIDADGQLGTADLQSPAFLAIQAADANNVTGDGTLYTLGNPIAVAEVYDVTNDYDPGGGAAATFTAPVDGLYFLEMQVFIGGLVIPPAPPPPANNDPIINTSNRTYNLINAPFQEQTNATQSMFYNAVCDMDAADTAIFQVQITFGAGTQTLDVLQTNTFISGYLIKRI